MVNLIAGKEIVPELIQEDFSAEKVVSHLNQIIPDGEPRDQMIAGLADVRARLRGQGLQTPAADRAADAIINFVDIGELQSLRRDHRRLSQPAAFRRPGPGPATALPG